MRPRTKKQLRIVQLSKDLPKITDEQKKHAYDKCFEKYAYLCKGFAWCTECGREFALQVGSLAVDLKVEDKVKCPYCGEELTIKKSRKTREKIGTYYDIITTCKEYQLFRHFYVTRYSRKGKYPIYYAHEVVQAWMDERGNEDIIAKAKKMSGGWCWCSDLELRNKKSYSYGYNVDKYHICGSAYWPKIKVLPFFKKRGIKTSFYNADARSLCAKLAKGNEKVETLLKIGQIKMTEVAVLGRVRDWHYKAAIIATRHNYKIKDATLWMDMIDMLRTEGKDIHNPKYICPKNLKKAHDYWLKRQQARAAEQERIRRLQQEEREARRNEDLRKKYARLEDMYGGKTIEAEKINIHVITSLEELKEEGEAMHHCVYTNYKEMKGWIILSARDDENNRLATIELDIKNWKVVQCRAHNNSHPARYKEIMAVLTSNMPNIKRWTNREKSVNETVAEDER